MGSCFGGGCLGAGRLGQIRIMDVISPDMFVSGCGAVAAGLQCMIDCLLEDIEVDADIVISNRSSKHTALSLLEDTRIVLVLLSDEYLRSLSRSHALLLFTSRSALSISHSCMQLSQLEHSTPSV